ncbi:DoxX family protein [uncultured Jatrophihabitans sp.]|uniref:DoxX family protein n=1 Tax=uncultured Jatrophihabitans sp. TaxID=1610747 RepID=UPI0035CBC744
MTGPRGVDGSDVAGFILRAAIGSTMIAHGMKHARSLEGTAGWFGSIGFDRPELQARASAVTEIGAGAALVVGAATPLSAAAVVGTMTVAYRSVHAPNGYFVNQEGWEYVAFLSAASVALSALGAGPASLDRRLGLDRRGAPLLRALLTAGLGLAGATVQLALFWRRSAAAPGANGS